MHRYHGSHKKLPKLARINGGASVRDKLNSIDGEPMTAVLGSHNEHRLSTEPLEPCAKSDAPGAHDDPKNSLNNVP